MDKDMQALIDESEAVFQRALAQHDLAAALVAAQAAVMARIAQSLQEENFP